MLGLALAALTIPSTVLSKEVTSSSSKGVWCAHVNSESESADLSLASSDSLSFRGRYRDFTLFVEQKNEISNCISFTNHLAGNDGIWVIEEPSIEAVEKTKSSLLKAGLPVYFSQGNSLIVGGGTEVPNVTGLDGCGADEDTSFIPVPGQSIKTVELSAEQIHAWDVKNLSLNPTVEAGVAAVSHDSLVASVEYLQNYFTRNSYSDTLYQVEDYLVKRLESLGFEIELFSFRADMAPNVIATWPSAEPASEWIITGSHYDSRNTNSSDTQNRAPGADDNGSGTSAMLELATIISKTISPMQPLSKGLQICFFTGEEQGLLGSRALASVWKDQGKNIAAMVNADMLGYQAGANITLGFKDKSVTPELVTLAKELTALYVPGLPTADSSSCCSDYLSFYEVGYPAVGFFESGMAASNYPAYHTSNDLLVNVNTEQLKLETQALVATVLTLVL